MNIDLEARRIIAAHTEGYMFATTNYIPGNNMELWETMISECSHILTDDFLEGKYTPMEYNAIRNEIARILNKIFDPLC